jgi:hypothetical protein
MDDYMFESVLYTFFEEFRASETDKQSVTQLKC